MIYYPFRINILDLLMDKAKGCLYEKQHAVLIVGKDDIFVTITGNDKAYSIIWNKFLKLTAKSFFHLTVSTSLQPEYKYLEKY